MINYLKKFFNGDFKKVAFNVKIGRNSPLGHWTEIGAGSVIGNNVEIGPWVKIGRNTVIGDDVHLGNWVRLGDDVIVESGSIIPDHVRVQTRGVVVKEDKLEGHELITPSEILPRRCSGSFSGEDSDDNGPYTIVSFIAGKFHIHGDIDYAHGLMEDYMNGHSDEILKFKQEKQYSVE